MSREYIRKIDVVSSTPAPLEVCLFDDFEHGWKYYVSPIAGGLWYRTPEKKLQGFYSLRSYNSSPVAGDYNEIYWPFGLSSMRYLRLSLDVCGSGSFTFPTLEITLTLYYGGRILKPTLRIEDDTHLAKIKKKDGNWVTLDMEPVVGGEDQWQKIELIVDLIDKKYQIVKISANSEDISSYGIYDAGDAGPAIGGELRIKHENAVAARSDFFLDQVYVGPTPATE